MLHRQRHLTTHATRTPAQHVHRTHSPQQRSRPQSGDNYVRYFGNILYRQHRHDLKLGLTPPPVHA